MEDPKIFVFLPFLHIRTVIVRHGCCDVGCHSCDTILVITTPYGIRCCGGFLYHFFNFFHFRFSSSSRHDDEDVVELFLTASRMNIELSMLEISSYIQRSLHSIGILRYLKKSTFEQYAWRTKGFQLTASFPLENEILISRKYYILRHVYSIIHTNNHTCAEEFFLSG